MKFPVRFFTILIMASMIVGTLLIIPTDSEAVAPPIYTELFKEPFDDLTGWTVNNKFELGTDGYYSDSAAKLTLETGKNCYGLYSAPITYPFEYSFYFNVSSLSGSGAYFELISFADAANAKVGPDLFLGIEADGTTIAVGYIDTVGHFFWNITRNDWHNCYVVANAADDWDWWLDGRPMGTFTANRGTGDIAKVFFGKAQTGTAAGTVLLDDVYITQGRGAYPGISNNAINYAFSNPSLVTPFQLSSKLYIPYLGNAELDSYMAYYDGTWHENVKVADTNIPGDYHGAPTMVITRSGVIHAFSGGHYTNIEHKTSTAANPTVWTAQPDFTVNGTYPFPLLDEATGDIYVLIRNNTADWVLVKSVDAGTTWEDPVTVMDAEYNYGVFGSLFYIAPPQLIVRGGDLRIGLAWVTDYDGIPPAGFFREDLFYAEYSITKGIAYNSAGENIGDNITYENEPEFKIYESNKKRSETVTLYYEDNEPIILWHRETDEGTYAISYMQLNGLYWTEYEDITEFTERSNSQIGIMTDEDGENLKLIFSNAEDLRVEIWERLGKDKWVLEQILMDRWQLTPNCKYDWCMPFANSFDLILIYEVQTNESKTNLPVRCWVYSDSVGFITNGVTLPSHTYTLFTYDIDIEAVIILVVFFIPPILLGYYIPKYGVIIGFVTSGIIGCFMIPNGGIALFMTVLFMIVLMFDAGGDGE